MATSIAYTMILRCHLANKPGMLGQLASTIGTHGGNIGAIDINRADQRTMVRDITVLVQNEEHGQRIIDAINANPNMQVLQSSDRVFLAHLGGKLTVASKVPLKTRDDLSLAYTPGVARVCSAIADDPSKVYQLTMKRNSVAVVTDGSAVLGLGNIGPGAALPVMEGKAVLFKELANIDAFPICLKGQSAETIINTVEQIAPTFGAINLEDIAAPICFDVEKQLVERLDIAVMHDDQHGTAIAVLAAMINALKVVGKQIEDVRVVVNGIGAAGTAIAQMLLAAGVGEVTAVDRVGILHPDVADQLTPAQQKLISITNQGNRTGGLAEALVGADAFVGVSVGGILSAEMVQSMHQDAIVFMMANPIPEGDPEIMYDIARVVATGRSDYYNQINNVIAFPGVFRGVLNVNASAITRNMHLAAAYALASLIDDNQRGEDYIIPSVFNRDVVPAVAQAVAQQAIADGVARRMH